MEVSAQTRSGRKGSATRSRSGRDRRACEINIDTLPLGRDLGALPEAVLGDKGLRFARVHTEIAGPREPQTDTLPLGRDLGALSEPVLGGKGLRFARVHTEMAGPANPKLTPCPWDATWVLCPSPFWATRVCDSPASG